MFIAKIRSALDDLYAKYNRSEYIHPDPLELVLAYRDPLDQEVVGLIAAAFSLGRVGSILKTTKQILRFFDPPRKRLFECSEIDIKNAFASFYYRFYKSKQLINLLLGMKRCITEFSSIKNCFASFVAENHQNTIVPLIGFTRYLSQEKGILPDPSKSSGCKRLHMYLRWMIRKDRVDPGCWSNFDPAKLIVPVDTHMLRISNMIGATERTQASRIAALEITEWFRAIRPDDPTRYDFCLTRLGIHPELSLSLMPQSLLGK